MANRRAASPGRFRALDAQGQVSAAMPGAELDNGAAGRAAASVFGGLADQLGVIADRAAAREGEDAGLAAGAAAATGAPLDLRRDGTIRGDAYDAAAERAYSWRLAANLDDALGEAFDANADNPDGFNAAVAQQRERFLKDPNLSDPQVREAFERNFAERSRTYGNAVQRQAVARQRADAQAAADEQFVAARGEFERRSFVLGGTRGGDEELDKEYRVNASIIDGQMAAGAITPAEGRRRKDEMRLAGVRARIRGTYDNLPDLAAKEKFAAGLIDAWGTGEGPLGQLDYNTVYGLQSQLIGQARAERAAAEQENLEGRIELKAALNDDVASLGATGKPVLLGDREIDPVDVARILGPREAAQWSDRRSAALNLFNATADFASLPDGAITARLEALAPQPGAEGFSARQQVYEAAAKKARSIIDLRRTDPASAVDGTFASVQQAKAGLNPDAPETYRRLAQARLAAQQEIGIAELARQPLTRREAQALALDVKRASNPGKATLDLARSVSDRYGDLSDEVLVQVLREVGSDVDAEATAGHLLRRIGTPAGPAARSPATSAVRGDTGRGEAAMGGQQDRPQAFREVPTYQSIELLLGNPALAAQFDARFGDGWAAFYLRQRQKDQSRVQPAPAAASPDQGESWMPGQ
ncbi:hypothetical protein [Ancylobacter terrae]|uniref:hypothetical protein n=1 Tax=Ancylobacter sp. sgz301288 TaxID=3342077 RepID=UPI003859C6F0